MEIGGLLIGTALAVALVVLEEWILTLPGLVQIGLLAVLAVVFVLGVVLVWRASRRGDESGAAPDSTFARLRRGSSLESEGSYSSAGSFFDLDEDSSATSRQDIHDPRGRRRREEETEGGDASGGQNHGRGA